MHRAMKYSTSTLTLYLMRAHSLKYSLRDDVFEEYLPSMGETARREKVLSIFWCFWKDTKLVQKPVKSNCAGRFLYVVHPQNVRAQSKGSHMDGLGLGQYIFGGKTERAINHAFP